MHFNVANTLESTKFLKRIVRKAGVSSLQKKTFLGFLNHSQIACSSHHSHQQHKNDNGKMITQVHSDQDVQLGQCTGLSNINHTKKNRKNSRHHSLQMYCSPNLQFRGAVREI